MAEIDDTRWMFTSWTLAGKYARCPACYRQIDLFWTPKNDTIIMACNCITEQQVTNALMKRLVPKNWILMKGHHVFRADTNE